MYKLVGHQDELITGHSIFVNLPSHQVNNQKSYLTCTSSNDEHINVWINQDLIESYLTNQFVFDVKLYHSLSFVHIDELLIFYAGSDSFIHILIFGRDKKLTPVIKLHGHRDWIRSLDIILKNGEFFVLIFLLFKLILRV